MEVPSGVVRILDQSRWQQARDWAATMFRRYAPEVIQQLQGTVYQMDAAVAQYQRRCNRLHKLLDEALALEKDLSDQIDANQKALDDAFAADVDVLANDEARQATSQKKQHCQENLAALNAQYKLQQEQVAKLESELAKVDATLAQLCSRQEVLKARFEAATARQQLDAGLLRPRRRRWPIVAAIAAGVLGVALVALMLVYGNGRATRPMTQFRYNDFSDVAGLTLNQSAKPLITKTDGTVLQLTPAAGSKRGSAFHADRVNVARFRTSFAFRMTEPGQFSTDGIAFVIQATSPDAIGAGGGGIGYMRMKPSVAVEFDTWKNPDDPNDNHVGIVVDGQTDHSEGLQYTVKISPRFGDGKKWYAWLEYDGRVLKVWLNQQPQQPATPVLIRSLDIPQVLGSDTAHVGFTSSTGLGYANHMILSWDYSGGTLDIAGSGWNNRSLADLTPAMLYSGFLSTAGLSLNGATESYPSPPDGTVLRLTPWTQPTWGSAYTQSKINVSRFSTHFTFRITNGHLNGQPGKGGDGFAFVLQPISPTVSTFGAGGLGIPSTGASVAVEFDTWCNGPLNDPSDSHIGIDIDGVADHGQGSPSTANIIPNLDDGRKWYAWIDYDGTTLRVWVSQESQRPASPQIVELLDIPAILGGDLAYIGFTSGGGAATADHMILTWTFAGCAGHQTIVPSTTVTTSVASTLSEVNPKVPPEACLLMTFEADTLVQMSGYVFAVRSLTGHYDARDSTAQFVPNGKVGGALAIESGGCLSIHDCIVNGQSDYTLTTWFQRDDHSPLWIYSEGNPDIIYGIRALPDGSVQVCAYNDLFSGGEDRNWLSGYAPSGAAPPNQWNFLAVRLNKGEAGKGELTIRVNDKTYQTNLQKTNHPAGNLTLIGATNLSIHEKVSRDGHSLIDELAVYQRALSDSQIESLYQMGMRGEGLGRQ
jgi:hypothetical protein